MTVAELIEKLKELEPGLLVVAINYDTHVATPVEFVRVTTLSEEDATSPDIEPGRPVLVIL